MPTSGGAGASRSAGSISSGKELISLEGGDRLGVDKLDLCLHRLVHMRRERRLLWESAAYQCLLEERILCFELRTLELAGKKGWEGLLKQGDHRTTLGLGQRVEIGFERVVPALRWFVTHAIAKARSSEHVGQRIVVGG